jgi:FtsP/CotA-like multicopper oxidase with cupredoxin domain
VRVPIEMDGVPGISQPEVKRGESFTYDFVVRDAGLYWYHPHVMSAAQVGFGLYGALLVEDPADGVGVSDELTLVLSDIGFDAQVTLPTVRRSIPVPATAGAVPVDVVLTLPPVDVNRHSEFRVNGVPFWKARPFLAKLGQTQLWTIKNDTQWDHPFHLHGFFFVVLDATGAPVRPLAWKDTINIPMNSTARFLVTFDERPGEWMFHCHILDHADGGLMGTVQVGDVTTVDHVHKRD